MKKMLSKILVVAMLLGILSNPIKTKAATYLTITSVVAGNDSIIVSIDSNMIYGYKLRLYHSCYIDGNICNPKSIDKYPSQNGEATTYVFEIPYDTLVLGNRGLKNIYNFKAFIYEADMDTMPPYQSNEIIKKITKASDGSIIISEYDAPETTTKTVKISPKAKKTSAPAFVSDTMILKVKDGKKVIKSNKLKFKSSNSKIAKVNKQGVITLKKAGNVNITITTKDKKKSVTLKLKVKAKTLKELTHIS